MAILNANIPILGIIKKNDFFLSAIHRMIGNRAKIQNSNNRKNQKTIKKIINDTWFKKKLISQNNQKFTFSYFFTEKISDQTTTILSTNHLKIDFGIYFVEISTEWSSYFVSSIFLNKFNIVTRTYTPRICYYSFLLLFLICLAFSLV